MYYSIIIPLYDEIRTVKKLLAELDYFYKQGHEVLIIDDGSTDGSSDILKDCSFIELKTLTINKGKGYAIKKGIKYSKHKKIIIYDSDLELDITEIKRLMILDKVAGINSAMGIRHKSINPFKSGLNWGNFIFNVFFNLLNNSCHKDILCCAKSFYVEDIPLNKLRSNGFDIDVELASFLTKNNKRKKIIQIPLKYTRRSINEGKKLKILDGWIILKRILSIL